MKESRRISDSARLEALVSPVRQDILDTLLAGPPMAVRELAEQTGRTATSLYYHLDRLAEVGLVRTSERTRTDGRTETLFRVEGEGLEIEYRPEDPENRSTVTRVVRSILRLTERDFGRGFDHEDARVEGPARNLWGARRKAWLDEDEQRRVNELLRELESLLAERRSPEGRTLCAVTWAITPVFVRSGGR